MEYREGIRTFTDDNRPCMVEISKGECHVKKLKLSMSKRDRMEMLIDLFIIGFIPAITVWSATQANTTTEFIVGLSLGTTAFVCGVGKTICDFANWLFAMNKMNEKFGEWYVEDITNICNAIIKDGCKVAEEEAARVSKINDKPDVESKTTETKAE